MKTAVWLMFCFTFGYAARPLTPELSFMDRLAFVFAVDCALWLLIGGVN